MSINFRKVLSLVLALLMVMSSVAILAACNNTQNEETNAGTEAESESNGEVVVVDEGDYTLNTYLSTFPTVWNNHTYQTATDGEFLGYTEPGFFTFDYNEDLDGYKVVPDMATKEPDDVTADYVGKWGIVEGDSAKVWKITIRDDIKWEDGTPITADDFIESMKLLLDPVASNYRADSMYTGNLKLVGAKDYFYGGKDVTLAADDIYEVYTAEELDSKIIFRLGPADDDVDAQASFRAAFGFPASYDAAATASYLISNYLADSAFTAEVAASMEGKTMAEIKADETMKAAWDALIGWWQTEPNEELDFFIADKTYEKKDFNTVGIEKISDTEFVLALEQPLKGFYLLYSLTGAWLVKTDLYKECIEIKDGVYNCTYGTSVDTYMSYGPYKLTQFQLDKSIVLEKNDTWYGYNDEENKGLYQTTKIDYVCIKEPETAFLAFLKGELDSIGLDATHIGEYSKSEHVYYTDGYSTFFIAMNPDLAALEAEQAKVGENINKTILTIKEFRMALSFALDRAAFNLACDPGASSGLAVYNNMIVSDPETGTTYRTTDAAKKVMAEFWGVYDDIGEGKLYADIDEALESITGYNAAEGKRLFQVAYDKAVEAGLMDADDKVEICIGLPSQHVFYTNGYEFLVNCYTEAVKGTSLEGRLTFTSDDTIGNGFSDALKANQVNLLFGVGWTGSALDPYNLMEAYTSKDYQYDPSWNTEVEPLSITLDDGKTYTASVWDWTQAIMGTEITITNVDDKADTKAYSCGLNDNKVDERLNILAAIEGAVLATYDLLPINNQSSAALKGMQVTYYTDEYIYGVGRGGVKYMTYEYNDEEWAAFVAENGGELNYK